MNRNTKKALAKKAVATAAIIGGAVAPAVVQPGVASALPPRPTPGGVSALPLRPPPALPAIVKEQYDYLGQGIHMDTVARVSRNVGLVSGEPTHTWTTWWGVGGHGSVAVELLDRNGDVIGVTNPQTYGVDAKSIFWKRHERKDYWSQQFDPVVTRNTSSIKILHNSAGRDNFLADLRETRDKACGVWQVVFNKACPLGPVN